MANSVALGHLTGSRQTVSTMPEHVVNENCAHLTRGPSIRPKSARFGYSGIQY